MDASIRSQHNSYLIENSFSTANENLDFDDYAHDFLNTNESSSLYLRFWESSTYTIILGRSN